jgi:hypothetical protein
MIRRLSLTLLVLISIFLFPSIGTAQDVDVDGIPDALEDELAKRFMPSLRPYQRTWYYEIGIGPPKVIYRVFYPLLNGVAYPEMIVISYQVLYHRDYGAHTLISTEIGSHDGDNEPFLVLLIYDYAIQDWRPTNITTAAHWHATCYSTESSPEIGAQPPQWEMHPNIYVGNRKHSNHVLTTWDGCGGIWAPDGDIINTSPSAILDEVWKAGDRMFNVGEPNAERLSDLGAVRPQWAGNRTWDNTKFRGAAGIIREALTSLNQNDWAIWPWSLPEGAFDAQQLAFPCYYQLSSTTIETGTEGDTGTLSLTAQHPGCGWRVKSNASWITATAGNSAFQWNNYSGAVGSGNGTINYTIAPNPSGGPRTGTITIGTMAVTVTQTATPCTFTASPGGFDFGTSASGGTVNLTASRSDCDWTASSNTSWMAVTGGASGSGNGTITFSVGQNTTTSGRSAILSIADLKVDINQAGVGCSTTLQSSSVVIDRNGGSASVGVAASPSSCPWTAVSNVPWATITSAASGTGSTTVMFTVASNLTGNSRSGTLSIAGHTFTIQQSGNGAPVVSLIAPANEATYARGATIDLMATASDPDGIARVEFYINGALHVTDTTSPYSTAWTNVPGGRHVLTAKAYDAHNLAATSTAISVNVPNLDTIAISPTNPKAGQTVSITVNGGNPCGAIGLNYGDGTTIVYPITALPMTREHVWSAAGTFTITAVGHGNCLGVLTQSMTIAANTPPTVTITAPASGASVVHPTTVTVSANASDTDGIARVEFFANDLPLGGTSSAPYSVTWQASPGSYSLVAVAYDIYNAGSASALVPITVTQIAAVTVNPGATVTGQSANVTVSGSPTCSAIQIDYGDGTVITYPIGALPTTQGHVWTTAGTKTIIASGQGDCLGSTTTTVSVSANAPPSVAITSPAHGSVHTIATAITISANASDTHGVWRVDFYAGSSYLGTDYTAPYAQAWSVGAGAVTLLARAYDIYGAWADSAVTVTGRGVVSVSASPSFIHQTMTSNITVTGSTTCGGVLIDFGDGTATMYPLSGLPTTQSHVYSTGGWKTITATGQGGDCPGQASTSIYVNYLPVVSLTAPVNGNTYFGPASISLAASAYDPDGAITIVYFYANGAYLGYDTTAPYTFDWANVPVGSYAFAAVAYDNSGGGIWSGTSYVAVTDPGPSRVTSVVAPATVGVGQAASITVYGTNPCGLVHISWGDGVGWHHAISQLPYSYPYAWSVPGTYTITAAGGGNCAGQASTTIVVQ